MITTFKILNMNRDFFDGLDIPHLDELEELKDALMSFSDNKSPGEDGFTK